MFELASSIHQLKLNDTEIGLFTAIILTTHGKSKSAKYHFLRKIDKNKISWSTVFYIIYYCLNVIGILKNLWNYSKEKMKKDSQVLY